MASVVQSPRRVQHVENVVTKLETGDLKLRVRVLESEAAFARIEAVQGSLTSAVMATLLLNAGVLMAGRAAVTAQVTSRAMFVLAGFFGLKIPVGYFKVRSFGLYQGVQLATWICISTTAVSRGLGPRPRVQVLPSKFPSV